MVNVIVDDWRLTRWWISITSVMTSANDDCITNFHKIPLFFVFWTIEYITREKYEYSGKSRLTVSNEDEVRQIA